MRIKKRMLTLMTAMAVLSGGAILAAPAASASTSQAYVAGVYIEYYWWGQIIRLDKSATKAAAAGYGGGIVAGLSLMNPAIGVGAAVFGGGILSYAADAVEHGNCLALRHVGGALGAPMPGIGYGLTWPEQHRC